MEFRSLVKCQKHASQQLAAKLAALGRKASLSITKAPIAALVLVGAGQWARATGGIPCVTPDKAITLSVQISYSNEAAGSGVMGAILSRRGHQSKTFFKIMHAHANYKRHTLRLKAQSETAEREPMRLNIHRSAATLHLGSQRHKLTCDWSEFS